MVRPRDTRTSPSRQSASISSACHRFPRITLLPDGRASPEVGPLQWGRIIACTYQFGGFSMTVGRLTPLQQTTPLKECFSINDVRALVAKHLGVDVEFVISEAHFTNDLGADLFDRVELML